MKRLAIASLLLIFSMVAALAQGAVPGQFVVPLGNCQLSATQLGAAIGLKSCVRATFTASAGSNSTQLVVASITNGVIKPGDQIVSGTGLTAGTVITGQISGTTGGAGTYQLSATNTASSATVTSGGIPPGATMARLDSEVASVRYRDDGGAPTAAIGNLIVNGVPLLYTGSLSQIEFFAASGSPLLDIGFYR